jgi:hypothetical protein
MSPKFNVTSTVEEQRRAFENLAKLSILPSRTDVQPVHVGDVPAEWISVGTTSEEGAVLYLHGGAYTIGSPRTHRDIAAMPQSILTPQQFRMLSWHIAGCSKMDFLHTTSRLRAIPPVVGWQLLPWSRYVIPESLFLLRQSVSHRGRICREQVNR